MSYYRIQNACLELNKKQLAMLIKQLQIRYDMKGGEEE